MGLLPPPSVQTAHTDSAAGIDSRYTLLQLSSVAPRQLADGGPRLLRLCGATVVADAARRLRFAAPASDSYFSGPSHQVLRVPIAV